MFATAERPSKKRRGSIATKKAYLEACFLRIDVALGRGRRPVVTLTSNFSDMTTSRFRTSRSATSSLDRSFADTSNTVDSTASLSNLLPMLSESCTTPLPQALSGPSPCVRPKSWDAGYPLIQGLFEKLRLPPRQAGCRRLLPYRASIRLWMGRLIALPIQLELKKESQPSSLATLLMGALPAS